VTKSFIGITVIGVNESLWRLVGLLLCFHLCMHLQISY